jgi:hypothetical protein
MARVHFVRNTVLNDVATSNATATKAEPTAAAFLDEAFITGNQFASHSRDGGSTWSFVNPSTTFPATEGGFCCDQIALHEPSRNLWIWILQYRVGVAGTNIFRLAISTSGVPVPWTRYWDFAPVNINPAWATNAWFDYPDATVINNHLYITYTVRGAAESWLDAVVFKLPLDGLASGGAFNYDHYRTGAGGAARLTRGAGTDMFFASHNGANPVRIFRWPDQPGSRITSFDVNASDWTGAGVYSSPGPDGTDWLHETDSGITGAWVVGQQAGFMWTANAGPGRPQPYAKALIVNTTNGAIVSQPDIWSTTAAWAYPAACPNADGVVGVSLFHGGGGLSNPGHVVGFLDAGQWVLNFSSVGTNGPIDNKWGDYVSCVPHHPNTTEWVAAGYTLQGGATHSDVEPQYVHFSKAP